MNKGLLAALAVVVVGGAAFMLTQEKPAKEEVKVEVSEAEEAKISIRSARKDANNEVKKLDDVSEDLKGNAEIDVQQMTDKYVKIADDLFDNKEKEIMTV